MVAPRASEGDPDLSDPPGTPDPAAQAAPLVPAGAPAVGSPGIPASSAGELLRLASAIELLARAGLDAEQIATIVAAVAGLNLPGRSPATTSASGPTGPGEGGAGSGPGDAAPSGQTAAPGDVTPSGPAVFAGPAVSGDTAGPGPGAATGGRTSGDATGHASAFAPTGVGAFPDTEARRHTAGGVEADAGVEESRGVEAAPGAEASRGAGADPGTPEGAGATPPARSEEPSAETAETEAQRIGTVVVPVDAALACDLQHWANHLDVALSELLRVAIRRHLDHLTGVDGSVPAEPRWDA